MDRIKRLTLKLTSQLLLRQREPLRLSCCLPTDGETKSLDVGLFAPTVTRSSQWFGDRAVGVNSCSGKLRG